MKSSTSIPSEYLSEFRKRYLYTDIYKIFMMTKKKCYNLDLSDYKLMIMVLLSDESNCVDVIVVERF